MILLCIVSMVFLEAAPSMGVPVPLEMVDMTHTFDERIISFPFKKKFETKVTQNGTTDKGFWVTMEDYSSATHVGTHADAPSHFSASTWSIDEVPIERLVAPAAVVDITEKANSDPDALVEIEDLRRWEQLSGSSLNKTIVVMKSGWGKKFYDRAAYIGNPDNDAENMHLPGMSPRAAQWLVDNRDVYGVASESLSLDNGKSWGSHIILLEANIYGLENVANVDKIPTVGATLYVMPMKIGKGSGAPTRIIATFPKWTPMDLPSSEL